MKYIYVVKHEDDTEKTYADWVVAVREFMDYLQTRYTLYDNHLDLIAVENASVAYYDGRIVGSFRQIELVE